MPKFSKESLEKFAQCDKRLQLILSIAIKQFDFKIVDAHRSQENQDRYVKEGKSKVKFGKHTVYPSLAVDIYPFPIPKKLEDPDYLRRFFFQAGIMFATANSLNIKIRWGGDWNMNQDFTDQSFVDLPHFELI